MKLASPASNIAVAAVASFLSLLGKDAYAMSSTYPFRIDTQCEVGSCNLLAVNEGPVPVMVQVDFVPNDNLKASRPWPFFEIVPARQRQVLIVVFPKDPAKPFKAAFTPLAELGDPRQVGNTSIAGYTRVVDDLSEHDVGMMGLDPECEGCPFVIEAPAGTPVKAARDGVLVDSDANVFTVHGKPLQLGELLIAHEDGSFAHYIGVDWISDLPKRGSVIKAGAVLGSVPQGSSFVLFGVSLRKIDAKRVLTDKFLPVQFGAKPVSIDEARQEVAAIAASKHVDHGFNLERYHLPTWIVVGLFLGSTLVLILAVYWVWLRFGKKAPPEATPVVKRIENPIEELARRMGSSSDAHEAIVEELFRNRRRYRGELRMQREAAAAHLILQLDREASDADMTGEADEDLVQGVSLPTALRVDGVAA